mgnify:CR=1 FL=1
MEIRALKEFLEQLGLPVAITSFYTEQALPFLVILPDGTESSGSDFAAELRRDAYQIELYTERKDFDLEEKLEELLDKEGIHFVKRETYIDEEAMYQCAYQIEFYYVK